MTFFPSTIIKHDCYTEKTQAWSAHHWKNCTCHLRKTSANYAQKVEKPDSQCWKKKANELLLVQSLSDFWGLQIHLLLPRWLSTELSVHVPRTVGLTTEQLKFSQPLVVGPSTDRMEKGYILHNTDLHRSSSHHLDRKKHSFCANEVLVFRIWVAHTVIIWIATLHWAHTLSVTSWVTTWLPMTADITETWLLQAWTIANGKLLPFLGLQLGNWLQLWNSLKSTGLFI